MTMAKKAAGRPAGSQTTKPPVATVPTSRCVKCDSTERERYFRTEEKEIAGVDPEGNAYTHVVWRWTRCSECGQVRVDRTYENRAKPARRAA